MTIKEMHYDFKKKLNKIDSQQYKNLLIPEIDWTLNEAQELFVKMVAKPRMRSYLGFELNQRTIDDIRTLVINNHCLNVSNNTVTLPPEYWHFIRAEVEMSKGSCQGIKGRFHVRQHDDEFENSPFDKSSFEWRTVNGVFFDGGIKLYDDGTFSNDKLCISYIKRPRYIHNAEDFRNGSYNLPSGNNLTGAVNCELPEHTHGEIVDIAVLIATGEIQAPDYQIKLQKLGFNNLK
jgi:hypothetical protein